MDDCLNDTTNTPVRNPYLLVSRMPMDLELRILPRTRLPHDRIFLSVCFSPDLGHLVALESDHSQLGL
jgi:hypothetical protein